MSEDKYVHSKVEDKIYSYWERNSLFKPKKNKKKFSIVIPPPNVTGSLHMGHALNNSLQDLLVRFYRMNGYETLWQPGTDHAGIATQAVVEKQLLQKGIKKNDLGRDKFIKEVWKWKKESGDKIMFLDIDSSNNVTVLQEGTGNHFLDIDLTSNHTINITQDGTGDHDATVNLSGNTSTVNLTQDSSTDQNYILEQNCTNVSCSATVTQN